MGARLILTRQSSARVCTTTATKMTTTHDLLTESLTDLVVNVFTPPRSPTSATSASGHPPHPAPQTHKRVIDRHLEARMTHRAFKNAALCERCARSVRSALFRIVTSGAKIRVAHSA